MKIFREKYGPWAVVTGASAGIGAEFAKQLAALKLNLVLVARRKNRLEELGEKLKQDHNIETKIIQVDLAERNFAEIISAETDSLDVGLLVNNAGFALTGEFLEHDLEKEIGLLDVNCRAPLILSHVFGRKMVERNRGGIIFVSSLVAFLPTPFWTNYSASKVYNLHLANGLYFELKKKGVDVLALCPGHTKTEFSEVAGIKSSGIPAEAVVSLAIKNLGKKPHVVPGIANNIMSYLIRLISRKWNIRIGAKLVNDMQKNSQN